MLNEQRVIVIGDLAMNLTFFHHSL